MKMFLSKIRQIKKFIGPDVFDSERSHYDVYSSNFGLQFLFKKQYCKSLIFYPLTKMRVSFMYFMVFCVIHGMFTAF